MTNRTLGEIISSRRKEKQMTQKELADLLNITDKAVSKWERNLAFPDTATIPKLAEILELSVEELLNVKTAPIEKESSAEKIADLVIKVIPVAMGVAVTVLSIFVELEIKDGFTMLGIGMVCIGIHTIQKK